MTIVYVNAKKFKIFRKKPRNAIKIGETKSTTTFKYSTNNSRFLKGIIAKRGNVLRYN